MTKSADQEQWVRPRTRKRHVRNRTGCITCRRRHLKCDEKRPICINCATAGQPCEFSAPYLPLRERRKAYLPGEQQPWAPVAKPIPVAPPKAVSPYHSHPINMPLKSLELFHYFHEVGGTDDSVSRHKRQNLLASVMQRPDALRNTLLIAGFHYSLNVGQLNVFEPTLLFHIIETIRSVNEWLRRSDPKTYAMCVRQISTLCLTECCLGNFAAAETHLSGLMKFMDVHGPPGMSSPAEPSVAEELSMRYIILTYSFISAFKSRLQDNSVDVGDATASEVGAEMHEWYKTEAGGLELKLKAMEMLPYFFGPLSLITGFRDIDASPMIDCLLTLTETSRLRVSVSDGEPVRQLVWLEGAATRLLLAVVEAHVDSLSKQGDEICYKKVLSGMKSSWSGIFIAMELYLHDVLGLWNARGPMEGNFHCHVLTTLNWDLARSESCLKAEAASASNLWFWKAFVGAFSLAKHVKVDHQRLLYPLQFLFAEFIRKWSKVTGIKLWEVAQEVLLGIAWPKSAFVNDSIAETLWNQSLAKN